MICKIYRSGRMDDTYLYLSDGMEIGALPDELRQSFGNPHFVMDLELERGRKLARVEADRVIESLSETGYFLQLPPDVSVEDEIFRRFC